MPDFNNKNDNMSLDEIEAAEQAEKKEKKKFNLFANTYKDGKGVDPDEVQIADDPSLKNFFKLIGRKINQLLTVNLLMVAGNFPIFFLFLALSGYLSIHTVSPSYTVYAPLRGAMLFHDSPAYSALWTTFSRQAEVTVYTTADKILFGLAALLIITYGLVRVGTTYIMRNMFRGEPVFMWHDFIYAIKRNIKQGLIFGILDVAINGLIIYDIMFFYLNYNLSGMTSVMFFMSICLFFLFFFMRQYIYLMLVTFDISIFKMFKNALLFTVLGVKRNALFFLGTILCAMFEYFLMYAYFPLAVILPFVILPAFIIMMGIYAAYPKIKEIMIDPYYKKVAPADDDN